MLDIVFDAFLDSIKILPFLFLIYILIEFIENNQKAAQATTRLLNGKAAPLVGAAVGVVPQCGFSVVAANLYAENYIKTGTLLAVLIATSDEALPILFTNVNTLKTVWVFLLVKVVYAVIVGYVVNLFDKRTLAVRPNDEAVADDGCCHHHVDAERRNFLDFMYHPIVHTVKVFLYILAINLLFGFLVYGVGEANLAAFLAAAKWAQPLVSVLVGLIPNCAASVLISDMFVKQLIPFSAAIAGLCANSGLAVAVLFREKKLKRNLTVVAALAFVSLLLGYVAMAFGF